MLANGEGLNQLIKIGGVQAANFREVMEAILARTGAAGRLLPATDAAFVAFARNTPAIRPWTQAVGDALEPFVRQGAAVQATLDQAPSALRAADDGLGRGGRLLRAVRDLATASAGTLPELPAGMRSLSQLLRVGGPPIQRLDGTFLGQARAGVNAPFDLVPSVEKLRPRVDELIPNLRPLLDELADHPCDFKNGTATLRSMTGFEQTSSGAELGPAMAFRLQAVVPGADGVGLGGTGSLLKRPDPPEGLHLPVQAVPAVPERRGLRPAEEHAVSRSHQARMRLTGLAFVLGLAVVTVLAFSGVYRKPFQPKTHTVSPTSTTPRSCTRAIRCGSMATSRAR